MFCEGLQELYEDTVNLKALRRIIVINTTGIQVENVKTRDQTISSNEKSKQILVHMRSKLGQKVF